MWNTTVSGFGVVMLVMASSMKPQTDVLAIARSKENLTSAEVIGWPFENLTPWRRWNVQASLFAERLYPVASQGVKPWPFGVESYSIS